MPGIAMKASKHVCFQSPSARPGDCEDGTRTPDVSAIRTYWKTRVSDCPRRTRALIPRETPSPPSLATCPPYVPPPRIASPRAAKSTRGTHSDSAKVIDYPDAAPGACLTHDLGRPQ